MTTGITTVLDAVAGLTVTGLTILDVDQILESVTERQTPLLYPSPDGLISNAAITTDTFGTGTVAKKTLTYTLRYILLYTPVGTGRGLFSVFDDFVAMVESILEKMRENDTLSGAIDVQPRIPDLDTPIADPAGNMFHGCSIYLDVIHFMEVA